MKPLLLFLFAFSMSKLANAQHVRTVPSSHYSKSTIVYSVEPDWNNFSSEIIKGEHIKSDSVYFYKKRKNNKDSVLRMTQYFDSLGKLIERDEYETDGSIFKITNYTYTDTALLKEETISKNIFYIKRYTTSKTVKTYERDSSGNIAVVKEYTFLDDSLISRYNTVWHREYDNSNHLTREFLTPPQGESYLRHSFTYENGILTEVKSYGTNKDWMYSYLYEFDETTRVRSVYLYNSSKTLTHEFYYDGHDRLIKELAYSHQHGLKDHITQTYSYQPDGQLETQDVEGLDGESYYFKHFYSK